MDKIVKAKFISIWIFIVPFVAVNTCLILVTQFHGLFQNQEDITIRERRSRLRKLGFSFETDNPDYLNSNDLNCRLIPPKTNKKNTFSLELNDISMGKIQKIKINEIPLLIKKDKNNLLIWPGICPHEGAELTIDCFKKNTLVCPWHDLKYKPYKLNLKNSTLKLLGLKIELSDSFIKISS